MAMTNAERQAAFKKRQKEKLGTQRTDLDRLQEKIGSFDDYITSIQTIIKSRLIAQSEKLTMIGQVCDTYFKADEFDTD